MTTSPEPESGQGLPGDDEPVDPSMLPDDAPEPDSEDDIVEVPFGD